MPASDPPPGVFVSYRRHDTAVAAHWLYVQLVAKFGSAHIFKDVDSIPAGEDFVDVITGAISACHTMLVVIGSNWLRVKAWRKVGKDDDFVLLEVETALERGLRIIPVLVDDAPMPTVRDLPSSISSLARRNAVTLRATRFEHDVQKLIQAIELTRPGAQQRILETQRASDRERAEQEGRGSNRAPDVGRDENPTQALDACAPDRQTVDKLLNGVLTDPHSVLGAHPHPNGTVVRTLRPNADEVYLVHGENIYRLDKVHDAGLFSGLVPEAPGDYRLRVRYGDDTHVVDDPYRWLPTLGEIDLHLIGEGRHERLWDALGAHLRSYDTPNGAVSGVSFAVWAPTAQGVRVTGDFDGWAGWTHPMRSLGSSGVWEIFVPGVGVGTRYKFRILGRDGVWREKSDPMAFATEIPPSTASVVTALHHEWNDTEWMTRRAHSRPHAEPMSVYEVHLASWRPGLDYRQMAHALVEYLDQTGFTHVELLPVAEHPFGGSWGYQVTSYYAPTARFGTPDDFRYFVDTLHQAGYGVIVDWVPAHFPKDEWALARFDGSPLYEHADPRRGEQPDWGTYVFDFGRREVRNFLVANALYWLETFHVDGLRVDAVASMLYLDYSRPEGQWLPNIYGGRENLDAVAFLQEMNATVYRHHPGAMTIADELMAWPGVTRPTHLGGLGFGFTWNTQWTHDTLGYAACDPAGRASRHGQMTSSSSGMFNENFVLPISHDEVVHGNGSLWERMPGDAWNKAANVRALLAFMWAHPGKQLLFMGSEFGQAREWSEERSLDWDLLGNPLHAGIKTMVGDLNRVYKENPALWTRDNTPEGFSWIDANDAAGNVLSFLRHGVDADGRPTVLACIANFSGGPRDDYRIGLPFAGRWREVLNTDAESYGGSGVGNFGSVEAEPRMWHGRPASAALRLPPSGVLWLAPEQAVLDEAGPELAADIGQNAPVAPFAPAVVGDTTPAVPVSPAGLTDAPELTSGDGAIGDVDLAYAVDDDGPPSSVGQGAVAEGSLRADEAPAARPGWVTAQEAATGENPLDAAPSAGVSADAPVVAPEVPEVEVPPLGTGPEEAPATAAYEEEPPELEVTPGVSEAVVDEPRSASDVTERPVAVGGFWSALDATTPSATRSPLDEPDSRDDESSTPQ
jgi:1,4-alpha-glucan branching enzyme